MAVFITQIHMEGGNDHPHIARVKWENRDTRKTGECSRADMVSFIDVDKGDARVASGTSYVEVGTVDAKPKYLRTYANGKWTDNLLALPRY